MELDLLKKFYSYGICMWNPNTNYLTYMGHFQKVLDYCIENKTYTITYEKWLDLLNSGNGASKIGSETHNICHGLNIIESTYKYGNVSNPNSIKIQIPRDVIYQYMIDEKTLTNSFWEIVQRRYFDFLNKNNIFALDGVPHIQRVCLNLFVCYLLDTAKFSVDEIKPYVKFAKDSGEDVSDKILKVYNYDVCKQNANILEKLNISQNGRELPNSEKFLKAILQSLEESGMEGASMDNILNIYKRYYIEKLPELKAIDSLMDGIELREDFVNEYPLDRIKELKLEEYALGTKNYKETLSYKLEFGKYKHTGLGIGGGSAAKHGIYLSGNGNYYGRGNKRIENPEEFWIQFRKQLYNFLVEVGNSEEFPNISNKYSLVECCPIVLAKLCFLYYPEKFINIGSKGKLEKIIDIFNLDIDKSELSPYISFEIAKYLKEKISILNEDDPQWIGHSLWRFISSYGVEEESEDTVDEQPTAYTPDDFKKEVFISDEKYDDIVSLLKRKKNIILTGAPGVGKTFMAKRLVYSLIGSTDKSKIKFIQFHQSYSYEEFIEGYRPNEDGGFTLEDGIFTKFCLKAQSDSNTPYYLIIDEINRGNLSKIFGELLMLIEGDKRGETLSLTYSKQPFSVPKNLYIIGLMNTADRSLAIIDYALRRRFSFINIEPAFDTQKFIDNFKATFEPECNSVIDLIKELNIEIKDDPALGEGFMVGHSYFCVDIKDGAKLTKKDLNGILYYEIKPLIEEYWYDDKTMLEKWKTKIQNYINS